MKYSITLEVTRGNSWRALCHGEDGKLLVGCKGPTATEALLNLTYAFSRRFGHITGRIADDAEALARQLQAGLDKHGYAKVDLNKPIEG